MQGFLDPYKSRVTIACSMNVASGDTPAIYGVAAGPFAALPGKTFSMAQGTGGTYQTYTFLESDFSNPHSGTVAEVQAALTAWTATIASISGCTLTATGATAAYQHLKIAGPSGATATLKVGNGTANEELGFFYETIINPTYETTGTSIVIRDQQFDFWSKSPTIDVQGLTSGTWVVANTGDYVSACTQAVVTPAATSTTILFTGTSAAADVLITFKW